MGWVTFFLSRFSLYYATCKYVVYCKSVMSWVKEGFHKSRQHPRGEGVCEKLTFPDIGGGGLTINDVSKKGYFAAIATNA